MKFPVVIKPSALLLVLRIVEVEFLASCSLFLASFLANYEQLYESFSFTKAFRYDIFVFLVASFLQLAITIAVFLSWYKEEFRLKEKEILHRQGFFITKESSVLLRNITSVEHVQNPFESWFGSGTILIWVSHSEKPFRIRTVDRGEAYANLIKDAIDMALKGGRTKRDRQTLFEMILEGEHAKLEFKQTFRFDVKKAVVNKDLEKAIMKAIAAFLNFEGGTLIVGISDAGKITGLSDDYDTLPRKDRDGLENHFNHVFTTMIGPEFRQYVTLTFETFDDKEVCVVDVVKAPKPVFLKANGEEEFFVRTGNASTPLSMSKANQYIESHFALEK